MIYHVTTKENWTHALAAGSYQAASLATEGFIHCSTKPQVAGVLERYYKDQTGLLLLHINEALLAAQLKYENAPSVNEEFPHIFGPINLNAISVVEEL